MLIALNAIFGWENDLENEEKHIEEEFKEHMKLHKLQHGHNSPNIDHSESVPLKIVKHSSKNLELKAKSTEHNIEKHNSLQH